MRRNGSTEGGGFVQAREAPPSSGLDSVVFAWGATAVLVFLAAVLAQLVARGAWGGVALFGITFLSLALYIRFETLLPRLFDFLFALAGALSAAAYVFGLWERIGPYDKIVHGFTTFVGSAAAGFVLVDRIGPSSPRVFSMLMGAVLLAGILGGGLWEVFEWSIGIAGDARDTKEDLVMNAIGAAAAVAFCATVARAWAAERARTTSQDGRGEKDVRPGWSFRREKAPRSEVPRGLSDGGRDRD